MEIKYNLTGTERKALVKTVSNIIGEKFKYLGAPSFAYQIGDDCTVTSDGTLKISNDTDNDKVEHLLEKLYECGYETENDGRSLPEQHTLLPAPGNAVEIGRAHV